MQPFETIYVEDNVVACDGGGLGHPRVYLNLAEKGEIECPYCSRLYIRKAKGSHDPVGGAQPAPAQT